MQTDTPSPLQVFEKAIESLRSNQQDFTAGKIKGVQHADIRSAALISAVESMAEICGSKLDKIISIDSRGELNIYGQGDGSFHPKRQEFSEEFGRLLTAAGVRTGAIEYGYNAKMNEGNSWCHINHFAAEKMVLDFAQVMQETERTPASAVRERPGSGG